MLFATDPKAKKNKTIFLAFDMLMTGLFSFFIFLMFIMGFAEWVMYPQVKLPVDVPLTDNGLIAILVAFGLMFIIEPIYKMIVSRRIRKSVSEWRIAHSLDT